MLNHLIAFLIAFFYCFAPGGSAYATESTQLIILGTGTPNANPERSGPAVAIVAGDKPYLIDAGPGVVRRAAAAQALGIEALSAENLDIVFITHLHSDHTLGLSDLILTPWVLDRKNPLRIYGPPGTKAMADHLLAAYEEDIRMRIDGIEPTTAEGYQTEVHEVLPGTIYRDDNVTVEAIPVTHGSWKHAYGYKFVSDDMCIVISGDTTANKAIEAAANNCEYLVHEVYSDSGFARRKPEWQRYHAAFHTSATELANIAKRSKPKSLALYHQLFWGTSEEDLLTEIRNTYDGVVISASDLDVFE